MIRARRGLLLLIIWMCIGMPVCLGDSQTDAPSPKVIHIINIKWKTDSSVVDRVAAIQAAQKLAGQGPLEVYTKVTKNQLDGSANVPFDTTIVMVFQTQKDLDKYADSQAQKDWYKVYLKVLDFSRTVDVTADTPAQPSKKTGGASNGSKKDSKGDATTKATGATDKK